MNDWPYKKFFLVVLSIQLAMWGVIGSNHLGIQIPWLRQIISVVYLFFVPGLVLIRVLKLHRLGGIKTLVYSCSLSVAIVMFTGILTNNILRVIGILQPLSEMPLLFSVSVVTSALCVFTWFRDRKFTTRESVVTEEFTISPASIFILLLPLLSIFGTQLLNSYNNNIILMVDIVLIALLVFLAGFTKFVPEKLYPLTIFSVTISLLLFRSLVSPYISGYDIHEEFASATFVQTTGYWNPSNPSLINSLPAINILPTVVNKISDLNLTILFKTMYPLLFAIASIGLFQVFKRETSSKIALFSLLFIVSAGRVYYDIALIPRQLTASLFLIASVLFLLDKNITNMGRIFLVIMGIALVQSHYGVTYIYVAILAFAMIANWLTGNLTFRYQLNKLRSKLGIPYNDEGIVPRLGVLKVGAFDFSFILFLVVFTLSWYLYTSRGTPLTSFSHRVGEFMHLVSAELVPPVGPYVPAISVNLPTKVLTYTNYVISYFKEIFIVTGFFAVILGVSKYKLSRTYLNLCFFPLILIIATMSPLTNTFLLLFIFALAYVLIFPRIQHKLLVRFIILFVTILFLTVIVPQIWAKIAPPFSLSQLVARTGFDGGRISHIGLLFIAPFMVIGFIFIIRAVGTLFKRAKFEIRDEYWTSAVSLLLVIGLMLETGFLWQVTDNYVNSPSLNQAWVKEKGTIAQKGALYSGVTPAGDVFSAEWLGTYRVAYFKIYASFMDTQVHPLTSYGRISVDDILAMPAHLAYVPKRSYVYLQAINVIEGMGTAYGKQSGALATRIYFDITDISQVWVGKNKIYTNGGSEIFK